MDRLLRRIVHFEAVPEVTPEAPAPEPSTEAPAPEVEAPTEEWSGPDRESWERISGVVESLSPLAELAGQGGFEDNSGGEFQEQQPTEIPDPTFDPQGYAEWFRAQVDATVQQTLEPYAPYLQQTAERTNNETLNGAVDALAPKYDFLQGENADEARSAVIDQARAIVNSGQEQDGERAMQLAAERVQGLIALGKEQGRNEYLASLQGGGPGDREPGVAGGAIEGRPQAKSLDELADFYVNQSSQQT